MQNQKEKKTTIATYHGNGRVTTNQVPHMPADDERATIEEENEDQTSPFFNIAKIERAITKHVQQQVRNANQ